VAGTKRYGVPADTISVPADSASEIVKFTISIPRESCTNAKAKYRPSSVVPPDPSVHFYHCLYLAIRYLRRSYVYKQLQPMSRPLQQIMNPYLMFIGNAHMWSKRYPVRPSICPSTGSQQQTTAADDKTPLTPCSFWTTRTLQTTEHTACRFAAVDPAGRRSIAEARRAEGECGQCHVVSVRR